MNKKVSTFSWIIGSVILAVFLRIFFIGVFKVPTITMAPSLLPGDFIISNKLAYKFSDVGPRRGDVIVFTRPEKIGQYYIKRVVAVPGDKFSISKGELIVNDSKCIYQSIKKVENFEYVQETCLRDTRQILRVVTGELKSKDMEQIHLSDGQYFVMGDNRDASEDSRDWGVVLIDQVSGKAQLVWLSIGSTQDSIS
ncbi:MAG: signal peptidase I, partial [Pseudobdellovibrio sp.]